MSRIKSQLDIVWWDNVNRINSCSHTRLSLEEALKRDNRNRLASSSKLLFTLRRDSTALLWVFVWRCITKNVIIFCAERDTLNFLLTRLILPTRFSCNKRWSENILNSHYHPKKWVIPSPPQFQVIIFFPTTLVNKVLTKSDTHSTPLQVSTLST